MCPTELLSILQSVHVPNSALTSFFSYTYSYDELLMDSSDEDEEETKEKKLPKGQKSRQKSVVRGRAWIKEGNEDDPVNFLDPGVVQRVIGL